MKNQLFTLFNRTFGIFFRWIQSTLISEPLPKTIYQLVKERAIEDSAEYAIQNFSQAMIFNSKEALWLFCIEKSAVLNSGGGVIAEFGVWRGDSINYFARLCPNAKLYGFDSFQGLEEDWYGFNLRKESFSTHGKMPAVEKNVTLFKGWFEETLPKFLQDFGKTKIQILHMDADTYKPTSYVLNLLRNNLARGTIIIFDEYFGYPNYRLHEFRAWNEFVRDFSIQFRYLGYMEQVVAIEII